ncbi:Y-family DNA polymerase [Enhygromyxa salina]|uniref:DNA polymerase IV n=1 Tax=Enhygromyxa salina TaxID=215803 RepID=A0A2S9YKD5_9BACT|nr:DNA repair nucleotidyltransferase [Enhygromyxa salina]PRQ05558.1 DNA polymerase IV [Enhygromyxa salina]
MSSQGRAAGADEHERVACVELPALPLQLLLLDQPSWREHPVAVVEADRPQAKLMWVNEHARRLRVLPGMRFAAARSLAPQLRASVISAERIEHAVSDLFGVLLNFSPRVEPGDLQQPGSFWIDPSGMIPLWGELGAWAMAMHQAVSAAGFTATVIVGFHRFRCLAIARSQAARASAWVITDPRREARMAAAAPLDRLGISARLRDALAGLGVRTLGEFMALPGPELRVRFGVEAERLHERGSDGHWAPMQARALVDPVIERVELDPPEGDVTRLLFRIKPVLERLLAQLADRGSAMSGLHLRLRLDHAGGLEQRLEPAAPTLDTMQVLELLRLRIDALELPAAVEEFTLELEGQRTDPGQIALFRTQARRDLEAADRAIARLCAALGPEAITHPQLRAAHLPEARLSFVPTAHVRFPEPRNMQVEGELPPRIRRLLHRPKRLPPRPRHEADGWVIDPELGPVSRLHGPYRASGGWWVREVERDYYFAQTRSGAVLWVFYDRPRRRWFLHGWLE